MQSIIQRRHNKMRRLRDAFIRVKTLTTITEQKTLPERDYYTSNKNVGITSPITKSLGSENENQLHHEFFRKLELPEKAQLTLEDIVSWPKAETKALLSHSAVPVGSFFLRKSTCFEREAREFQSYLSNITSVTVSLTHITVSLTHITVSLTHITVHSKNYDSYYSM